MSDDDYTTEFAELLSHLDMTVRLEPGELVAGAIMFLKVVDEEGNISVRYNWSDGIGPFERIGVLSTYRELELREMRVDEEE